MPLTSEFEIIQVPKFIIFLDFRFLGTRATVFAFGVPVILLLLSSGYYLLKAAIVSRYTCSMQLEVKQREKLKRRRALQLILFSKVSLIIGVVAACGVASHVWKLPFLWAVFCTGHSIQVRQNITQIKNLANLQNIFFSSCICARILEQTNVT